MKEIIRKILADRTKSMPILSFPSTQLVGCSVAELVTDSKKQAEGMKKIASDYPVSASLNMMDLSVEAEAFGATVLIEKNEIPNIVKPLIDDITDAPNIVVPEVGAGRTQIYIDGIKEAKKLIKDTPIMCGVIGPYSLAGRLFDMTELMMACYEDEDNVAVLLEKCTEFLISYIKAFKSAGADGVIMAEPAAGLISPDFCERFSTVYVRRIFEEVNSDDFALVYHNCGNVIPLLDSLQTIGADIYHFGNAVDMKTVLEKVKGNTIVMGNINPVDFRTGTPESVAKEIVDLLERCGGYDNFYISSGCDIPADSKWENIESYFNTVKNHYRRG